MTVTEIKLVLVGNTGVGKTSIVKTAISGTFTSDPTSTLAASYSTKSFQLDSRTIRLQIWDTAGQEKYRGMAPMYYHNAQIAMVVYSVIDRATFDAVDFWMKSLRENAVPGLIVFIVANKIDIAGERAVSGAEGTEHAARYNAEFMEVSAKTGYGIGDLFMGMPRAFLDKESTQLPPITVPIPTSQGGCCG
jgi:small GTP-binding protein